jgi:hypothetical protein
MFVIILKKSPLCQVSKFQNAKAQRRQGMRAETSEKCFEKPPFLWVYFLCISLAKKTLPG